MYIFAQADLLLDWSDITLVFFSNLYFQSVCQVYVGTDSANCTLHEEV